MGRTFTHQVTIYYYFLSLDHLDGAGGAIGVGGNDDGQAVSLGQLLTSQVEVAYASDLLAVHHLVDAGNGSYNELISDLLAGSLAGSYSVSLNAVLAVTLEAQDLFILSPLGLAAVRMVSLPSG